MYTTPLLWLPSVWRTASAFHGNESPSVGFVRHVSGSYGIGFPMPRVLATRVCILPPSRNRGINILIVGAFFGTVPEDFGNRGESTITKLPVNKQWQEHHKKKPKPQQIEWRWFFFLHQVETAVWPREFYHFVTTANSRGKIPVVKFPWRYHGSYSVKKNNTVIRFAVVWSVLWWFCRCLFLILVKLCYGWFTAIPEIFGNGPEEGPANFWSTHSIYFRTE